MCTVKPLMVLVAVAAVLSLGSVASATITLQFDPNDIFNYPTSDDTRLNQLGTARYVQTSSVTGRYYQTYNDGTRDAGATASGDLQSVQNIMQWNAFAGYQGVSHLQLWLSNGNNAPQWGETVVQVGYQGSLTASVNGEYDWDAAILENPWDADGNNPPYVPGTDEYGIAHFNTELGGAGHQNAISPDFNPAEKLWSVTGDFYVDENANGQYDPGTDSALMVGQQYPIWFAATFNNWHCVDDYGNDAWGSFLVEGTLMATAVPEPASLIIWGLLGAAGAGLGVWRRRRRGATGAPWPEENRQAILQIVERGRLSR